MATISEKIANAFAAVGADMNSIKNDDIVPDRVRVREIYRNSDVSSSGWHTIAKAADSNTAGAIRAFGEFELTCADGGRHTAVRFTATHMYGSANSINITAAANYGSAFVGLRILSGELLDGAVLQVRMNSNQVGKITCRHLRSAADCERWELTGFVPEAGGMSGVGRGSGLDALTNETVADLSALAGSAGSSSSGPVYAEGGQRLTTPLAVTAINSKRYVNASDWVPSDDTQDVHAGLQAMFSANPEGKEFVFTPRTYRFLNRDDKRLYLPQKGRIIWEAGALTDFTGWGTAGTSDRYFYAAGTLASVDNVSNGVTSGSMTIPVSSSVAAKWKSYLIEQTAGQSPIIGYITADNLFTPEEENASGVHLGAVGEWIIVEDVDTTRDVLVLAEPLRFSYLIGVTIQHDDNLLDLTFDNPQILGAGRMDSGAGDRGISTYLGRSVTINGGTIAGAEGNGIHIHSSFKWMIDGTEAIIAPLDYVDEPGGEKVADVHARYPIAVANCCHRGVARDYIVRGGREGFALTSSGTPFGVTRNTTLIGGHHVGQERSGICTHDNHEGLRIIAATFEDCEQFIDIRIRDVEIRDCYGRRSGTYDGTRDAAVRFGSGAGNVHASNNRWEDVLRGWYMPDDLGTDEKRHELAPGEIHIHNDRIRGDRCVRGIQLTFAGSTDPDYAQADAVLGPVTATALDYKMSTEAASVGVVLEGRWDEVLVTGQFTGGRPSNPAGCVFTAGNDVAGTAPKDITVDVAFSDGFNPPILNTTGGVVKKRYRGIGHTPSGETFGSPLVYNDYWNIGSMAPQSTTYLDIAAPTASVGDFVQVSTAVTLDGVWLTGEVISAGTVRIHAFNATQGTRSLSGGQFYATVTSRT